MKEPRGFPTMEEAIEAWNTWKGRYINPEPEDFIAVNPCNDCGDFIDSKGNYLPPAPDDMTGPIGQHQNGAFEMPWPRIHNWKLNSENFVHDYSSLPFIFALRARWCALFHSVIEYREEITTLLINNDYDNKLLNSQLRKYNEKLERRGFIKFEENDLRGINLGGLVLIGRPYKGINLRMIDFSFSDISVARLDGANFYKSKFYGVSGSSTSIRFAICQCCDFSNSFIPNSNFTGTDISRSNLTYSNFNRSNFNGADISNSDIRSSRFTYCSFLSSTIDTDGNHKKEIYCDFDDVLLNNETDFSNSDFNKINNKSLSNFIENKNRVLDSYIHDNIVNMIQKMAISMERHPSTYINRGEEDIRDHFITALSAIFPNITAETFNHRGKTDILIRNDGNIFIAECKFWSSKKVYYSTIDQILSYLTSKDYEATIILFVRNKKITSTINAISESTKNHSSFISQLNKVNETWFKFSFHSKNNSSKYVILNVLVLHFPH